MKNYLTISNPHRAIQNEVNSLLQGWVKTARDKFEVYTKNAFLAEIKE